MYTFLYFIRVGNTKMCTRARILRTEGWGEMLKEMRYVARDSTFILNIDILFCLK